MANNDDGAPAGSMTASCLKLRERRSSQLWNGPCGSLDASTFCTNDFSPDLARSSLRSPIFSSAHSSSASEGSRKSSVCLLYTNDLADYSMYSIRFMLLCFEFVSIILIRGMEYRKLVTCA